MQRCTKKVAIRQALDGRGSASKRADALLHLEGCADCAAMEREEQLLRGLLCDQAVWEQADRGDCLTDVELSGVIEDTVEGLARARAVTHMAVCVACATEVDAVQAALSTESPALSPEGRTRMLALGGVSADGLPLAPAVEPSEPAVELSEIETVSSGETRRGSGRRSRTSSVSGGSGRVGRPRRSSPRTMLRMTRRGRGSPPVWGPVAAAAAVLVAALTLFGILSGDDPGQTQVASGQRRSSSRSQDGAQSRPLVSDSMGREAGSRSDDSGQSARVADPAASAIESRGDSPRLSEPAVAVDSENTIAGADAAGGLDEGWSPPPAAASPPAEPSTRRDAPTADPGATVVRKEPDEVQPQVIPGGEPVLLTSGSGSLALKAVGQEEFQTLRRPQRSLAPGSTLRAGRKGAWIVLDHRIEVALAPGVEVGVERGLEGRPQLSLDQGRLVAELERRDQPIPFSVRTGAAVFSVTGTVFGVEAKADDGSARVSVSEGEVLCTSAAGTHRVSAGRAVSVRRGESPAEIPKVDVERDLAWSLPLRPRQRSVYVMKLRGGGSPGWTGTLVPADQTPGGDSPALRAEATPEAKYWGCAAKLKPGRPVMRVEEGLRIKVSFWLPRSERVLIQCYNITQGKYFRYHLGQSDGEEWITVTIPAHVFTTYTDPDKNPIRNGDVLKTLEVWAGPPGEDFGMLLKGVRVYQRAGGS